MRMKPLRARSRVGAFLTALVCLTLSACGEPAADYREATIVDLHDAMNRDELTSEALVNWYLDRIEAIDGSGPALNSVIELNPDALDIARSLDDEWQVAGPRGPLHGIPVVLKANIDTADRMHTTAGSLALADHIAPADAFLVSRLRDAGAVILGKANLSEWANYRSNMSSSGWSSIGGQTRNPYDTQRNPCGSSSGSAVAVAANLTTVAVGTETDGSIVCPSGINGFGGIKPTRGLVSRYGVVPIAQSQARAGPMARTVRVAGILLEAMLGTDSEDPASAAFPETPRNYTANLAADGLAGRRIGVLRSYWGAGDHAKVETVFTQAIETVAAAGAEIVDPIKIETPGMWQAESEVLDYEFKADLNRYLEKSQASVGSLAEVIEFNSANADTVMPIFGQELMIAANQKGALTDEEYLEAAAAAKRISREAIEKTLAKHKLDALIAPTNGPAWMTDHVNGDNFQVGSSSLAAVAGYPNVTVPAGFVSGLPIGVSFMGPANSEKTLIEIAYAFEQASNARKPPEL